MPSPALKIHATQFEFHPLQYTSTIKQMLEYCSDHGIIVQAYSPLAQGHLLTLPEIQKIAAEISCTPAQLCLAWVLKKKCVAVVKASCVERLKENLEAGEVLLNEEIEMRMDVLIEHLGGKKFCWDPKNVL